MSDLFLGIADPEFWRNCGYALLAIGLIGAVAVILLLDRHPRLQKGLALLFIAVVLALPAAPPFPHKAPPSEARRPPRAGRGAPGGWRGAPPRARPPPPAAGGGSGPPSS